jgi:hypothetical protein
MSIQFIEGTLQFLKPLPGFAELSFGSQALVLSKILSGFRDESSEIRCGLRGGLLPLFRGVQG